MVVPVVFVVFLVSSGPYQRYRYAYEFCYWWRFPVGDRTGGRVWIR